MSISRRQFGEMAVAATAGGIMASPSTAQNANDGWIDAHVHVWTDDVQRYPLDQNFKISDMKPPRFTPEDLFVHTEPNGVSRIVLIQMSFYNYDNSYMLDVMDRFKGKFSGVGIVDIQSSSLEGNVIRLARRGVRGLRIVTRGDKTESWLSDPGMQRLWKIATREKIAICPLINPPDLSVVDRLCEQHPETTVVIDHFARIGMKGVDPSSLDALCKLARYPKVHVKTSAFYAVGGESPYEQALPMLQQVLESFGADRLMWASDCPYQVQKPHEYLPALAIIRDKWKGLSDRDRQWILRGTAEKLFFS